MTDFERPLTHDGMEGAKRIGIHMARNQLKPDTVFCSPATRTMQTLAELERAGAVEHRSVQFEQNLYGGNVQDYFDLITEKGWGEIILLIGHNPMIEDCALALCGETNNEDALRSLEAGFPPAGLAVLDTTTDWDTIKPGIGSLKELKLPS